MRSIRRIATAILVALGVVGFTVGIATAVSAPKMSASVGGFTANSPAGLAPTPCIGSNGDAFVTTSGTATGPSTDTSSLGLFSLAGTVTLKATQLADLSTGNIVSFGSFSLSYGATDPTHKVKGSFQAVAKGSPGANPYPVHGRGFANVAQLKKTSTGFQPTGLRAFLSVEFVTSPTAPPPDGSHTAPTATVGHFGDSTDGYDDFAAEFGGGCP